LESTVTYYVEEQVESPIQGVGPEDNTFGSGGYFDANDFRGLYFDVFTNVVIASVKVYAGSDGDRTIQVLDGEEGVTLHEITTFIPEGESIVTLNFAMTPGTDYFIKVSGDVDLFRISDGSPDYPYVLDDVVAITRSNASDPYDYYYFFFDWKLQEPACNSLRSAITAIVNPLPVVLTSGDVTIPEGGSTLISASGGIIYSWFPPEGLSDPNISNPIASPLHTTSYTVTVTDVNDCVNTATLTVFVDDDNALEEVEAFSISITPNPTDGILSVVTNTDDEQLTIQVLAGDGRQILNELTMTKALKLDLRMFPPGVYFIRVKGEQSVILQKCILM
jgi:hypothetical protein